MADGMSVLKRWRDYRPSKTTVAWSCIIYGVAIVAIGFTWGGWVTEGTANNMARKAESQGRIDLAASICVSRFMNGQNVKADLLKLKNASSWDRADLLKKDGWVMLPGQATAVEGAGDACAEQLVKMEPPLGSQPAQAVGQMKSNPQTVQQ